MDLFLNNHLVYSIIGRIYILGSYVIDHTWRTVAYRVVCINLHNVILPILKKTHYKTFSWAIACEFIRNHVKMGQHAILCIFRHLHFLYNAIDMLQFLPGKNVTNPAWLYSNGMFRYPAKQITCKQLFLLQPLANM